MTALCAAGLAALGAAREANTACKLLQVAEIPVTMQGNAPMIPASINGHAVTMLVDTGAGKSMLWRSAATDMGLRIRSNDVALYGYGGADYIGVVGIRDLGLAGATIHSVEMFAGGRGSAPGGGVGLIGEDLLSNWDLELDLSAGKIRLFAPKDCRGDQVEYWAPSYFVVDLRFSSTDDWLRFNVRLNGHEVQAMLDSGAPYTTVTPQALEQTGVKPETEVVSGGGGRGVAGKAIKSGLATFSTLAIGQETAQNVKLQIADMFSNDTTAQTGSHISKAVTDFPALLIGSDFLMAHRLYVARSEGKIYFTYKGGPVFQHYAAPPPAEPPSDSSAPAGKDAAGATSH